MSNINVRLLLLLFAFCLNTAEADFSDAFFVLHPKEPERGQPFLIEITGNWPTDCHPGEQKPVVIEYTGDKALIEFETIVEHVSCNDVVTPYRVLVDMSDVLADETNYSIRIEVTLRFNGEEFVHDVSRLCICTPSLPGPKINPERGLYASTGLEKQGLLLGRQNQRMAVYPLVYDQTGSSQWLIGGSGIVEDVYFTDLYELTGGQCLGCAPPIEAPQSAIVGKLTMLMDSEGVIQVKVNDGLFTTYEPIEYGYGEVHIGGHPEIRIPDLSGRWAFVEVDSSKNSTGSPPPTVILPLVFDIQLTPLAPRPPTVPSPPPFPPGDARYSIRDVEGKEVAQLVCEYRSTMFCVLNNAANGDGFAVQLVSPERMILTSLSPVVTGKIGSGTAVRID